MTTVVTAFLRASLLMLRINAYALKAAAGGPLTPDGSSRWWEGLRLDSMRPSIREASAVLESP